MKEVRVRFAPSPTGALHIGGARTALYNFLFARRNKGKCILRIEDTDRNRYVEGAERHIRESLSWLGICFDEGPDIGGDFAPYRQSERNAIYQQYAKQLIDSGHAYLAFDSEEELQSLRERLRQQKNLNPQYDATTRMQMQNSLSLSEEVVKKKLEQSVPFVIRLKTPENEAIKMSDLIRGEIKVPAAQIDDKVLIKSDGRPTYHLANVVDDYLMKISHVIRGEEWLPSAPCHALIYRYLGWGKAMPAFAHLPLLLKPDGRGKLSKRDAEQMDFPILPIEWVDGKSRETKRGFRERGYLPAAVINFLALLGWNPGDDRELFTMTELTRAFDIEKIGKAGARFLVQKAKWFNQHYLRAQPDDELVNYLTTDLAQQKIDCNPDKALLVVRALKERVTFPRDFFDKGMFFFTSPTAFDGKMIAKLGAVTVRETLLIFGDEMKKATPFSESTVILALDETIKTTASSKGKVMQTIRMALTGEAFGLDLIVIINILGKEETLNRLEYAQAAVSNEK